MAYSGLLLLLIGALSSPVPEAEAGPLDFWCKPEIRGNWRASAGAMIDRMIDCQRAGAVQDTPVQCPFVGINPQRWDHLTILEKFSETMSDLQVFQDGLEETNITALSCQPLLKDIALHIGNNKAILQRQMQNATVEASSPPQTCPGLTEALRRYQKLLQGKLELFVSSYGEGICSKHTADFISDE